MKRIMWVASFACLALTASPALAGSIGTYSGCKQFSGNTKQACLDCVGGGNFYQSTSRTCGLAPGMKPSKPAGGSGSSSSSSSSSSSGGTAAKPTTPVTTIRPPPPPPLIPPPLKPVNDERAPGLDAPSALGTITPPSSAPSVTTKETSRCSMGGAGVGGDLLSPLGLVAAGLALFRRRLAQRRKSSTESP